MDSRVEIRPGRFVHIHTCPHPTSDKTAFLIHGLGGRGYQWRNQVDLLKQNYNLVIPDLLGHDLSDKPKPTTNFNPYSFLENDQDIQALFRQYSTNNNIVLGHSYGGALATSLALDHQDKINKLILISPLPCSPQISIPFIYQMPLVFMQILRPLLERKFRHLAFSSHAAPTLISTELEAAHKNPMYVIKNMVRGMEQIPKIDLTMLNIPTLALMGEPDYLVPTELQKICYQQLPQLELNIIKDSSHMSILEMPERVNQDIANFLTLY